MKIECLFIIRDRQSGPELVAAWDEYSVMENVEGWQDECKKVLDALEGDFLKHAYVHIEIPDSELNKQFDDPPAIQGKIVDDDTPASPE